MKNKLIQLFTISVVAFSCSSHQEKISTINDSIKAKQKPDLNLIPEANSFDPIETLPPEIKTKVKHLDSIYSKTIFYAKAGDQYLFYVVKGDWKGINEKKFNGGNFKMGLVNENLIEQLPCSYDKIYNPNATAQDYIEIEKNGKKGLYNFKTKNIIEPIYDLIFPSPNDIAIGKIENEYFQITEHSTTHTLLIKDNTPTYDKISATWDLDSDNKNLILLRDLYQDHFAGQEGDEITNNGFVFTPSFLYNLGILKEYTDNLDAGKNSDFVQIHNKITIDNSKSIGEELIAYVTVFFEDGIAARDYTEEEYSYVVTDKNNNVLDKKVIGFTYGDVFVTNFCEDKKYFDYKYLNETLFELRTVSNYRSAYEAYNTMPCYYYYEINKSNKIDSLTTNRMFPFTKFTEINDNYFKGCYARYLSREELDKINEGGNMYLAQHLTIEDLDLMINEIYAEYGYKFKNEKWKNYFGNKSWYKPQQEQTEPLFTELDKKNIKFIKDYRDKMKGKEESFTKKKLIGYAAAG